jgi:microcin C transport system ATP-binding protein
MTLLNIQNLCITLTGDDKRTLVDDISFSINRGETLALVGESGSGKSLTALAIMRLLGAYFTTSGSIQLENIALDGATETTMQSIRGHDIGMIFQEPMTALNPLHTIGKQIGEAINLHTAPRSPDQILQHVKDLLTQVGLAHFADRMDAYPHQLSGGERQRVMIAMAIANKPKLLIADEPTTAVDVHVQQTILDLLNRLKQELGMSMLFITHDLPLVKRMADQVAVMKQGKIVEIGKVADVFSAPAHPYTKSLLESAPKGSALPLPENAETRLEVEQLSVQFPIKQGIFARTTGHHTVVRDVNFSLKAGETIGIVGESGSGKTTLAMALLKMQPFSGGAVFLGHDLSFSQGDALRALRKHMQLVFQDPYSSLNPRMTVGQIIGEGLTVHEPHAPHLQARIHQILEKVGLSADMSERYPHEFSGGQRQRISIARAMILEPKLVILDEPTSALDLTVQSQIIDVLKAFQQEQGLSYLFISHDLRVIRAISHRIIVLKQGTIVETAETQELFSNPTHEYSKRLIETAMV